MNRNDSPHELLGVSTTTPLGETASNASTGAPTVLANWEEALVASILRRNASDPTAATEQVVPFLPAFGRTALEQLEAYRRQYFPRLCGVLEDDYQALAEYLGAEKWDALVEAYVHAAPPRDWNLYAYGAGLPAFLATYLEDEVAHDLARLEWAFCDGHDAPDHRPLASREDAAALLSVPAAELRLPVQPALRLVKTSSNLCEYRDFARAAHKRGGPSTEAPHPLLRQTTYVVVARRVAEAVLEYTTVSAAAFHTLRRLQAGEPLGAALEGATEDCAATTSKLDAPSEALGDDVATWFQQWTTWGWI